MGLIGSLLAMLYCGGSGVYLSPIAFILNPCLWLLLASTYKATHLQGPNFAYALVLRRFATFPAKEKLALQSIQHIFDAAEPIVSAITPVPGGVGSVTTAVLALHVAQAAENNT